MAGAEVVKKFPGNLKFTTVSLRNLHPSSLNPVLTPLISMITLSSPYP
jgi:hypothetical protein